jgi:hypothetical protein
MSESSRKLSSLPLPQTTLFSLAQIGYETLHDLQAASAHGLANGQALRSMSVDIPIIIFHIERTRHIALASPGNTHIVATPNSVHDSSPNSVSRVNGSQRSEILNEVDCN